MKILIKQTQRKLPIFYSDFIKGILNEEIGESCITEQVFNDEEDTQEFSLRARLTDAAKINSVFTEIVSMFEFANYNNNKTLMTKSNMDGIGKKHALEVEFMKKLSESHA